MSQVQSMKMTDDNNTAHQLADIYEKLVNSQFKFYNNWNYILVSGFKNLFKFKKLYSVSFW